MPNRSVGPELRQLLQTINKANRRIVPTKQRALGAVTNVGAMARFLDTLVKQHSRLVAGSAFAHPRERMELKLVNTATTPTGDGKGFRYFDAVDRGRAVVHARKSFALVFAESDEGAKRTKKNAKDPYADVVFRAMTGAAAPADITNTALATIHSTFPRDAVEAFRAFLNNTDFNQTVSGRKSGKRRAKLRSTVGLGNVAVKGTRSRDVNSPLFVPSGVEERKRIIRHFADDIKLLPELELPRILAADPETQQQMLNEARLNAQNTLLAISRAAREAGETGNQVFAEAQRQAQARAEIELRKAQENSAATLRHFAATSSRSLRQIFPKVVQTSKYNKTRFKTPTDAKTLRDASKAVQALMANTSYTKLVNVFKPLLAQQVQAFKDATPSRAETGLYKLELAKGHGGPASGNKGKKKFSYQILKPETGGQLRESYVFMTDESFARFVRKVTKTR